MTRTLRAQTNSDAAQRDFEITGTLLSRSRYPGAWRPERLSWQRSLLCLSGKAVAEDETECAPLHEKKLVW